MDAADSRILRVRVSASEKRLIGYVDLPADLTARFSDLLNGPEAYIVIRRKASDDSTPDEGKAQAILKDSIRYIEALEEPTVQKRALPGMFHTVTAELKEPTVVIEGELFVADGSDIMDVINDPRRFISLRNVRVLDSVQKYVYLAVGKKQAHFLQFSEFLVPSVLL